MVYRLHNGKNQWSGGSVPCFQPITEKKLNGLVICFVLLYNENFVGDQTEYSVIYEYLFLFS